MKDNPLGKTIGFTSNYDPKLLFSIPRKVNRNKIGIQSIDFTGFDVWNAYEISWLGPMGKPEVRRAKLVYSADSENIVESKSLKLYLGSFSMSTFDSEYAVRETIEKDLSEILKPSYIGVHFYGYQDAINYTKIEERNVIDNLEVSIDTYCIDTSLLRANPSRMKTETLVSNLLKTNCPITNQPDLGTVVITYKAENEIDRESLLKYIVSFREDSDYHEACCEQIFYDLYRLVSPEYLEVGCYFTRRGGIDINPCRIYGKKTLPVMDVHFWRQ